MNCPDCGNNISQDDNFCAKCGKNLKNIQNSNENLSYSQKKKSIISYSMLFLLIIIGVHAYLSKVGSTINLDDSNVPEIMLKADDCSSSYVESEVISIFKENDPYFKNIALKSVDGIRVLSKDTLSENKNSTEFICSGVITMTSARNGFKPLKFDENNIFYNLVYLDYDESKIKKYNIYELPVVYTSKMYEDKNIVEINELNYGEFNCNGICEPVYKLERKIKPKIQNKNTDEPKIDEIKNEILINETEINQNIENKVEKKKRKFRFFRRNKNTEI